MYYLRDTQQLLTMLLVKLIFFMLQLLQLIRFMLQQLQFFMEYLSILCDILQWSYDYKLLQEIELKCIARPSTSAAA
jgi:hypothetical protein